MLLDKTQYFKMWGQLANCVAFTLAKCSLTPVKNNVAKKCNILQKARIPLIGRPLLRILTD